MGLILLAICEFHGKLRQPYTLHAFCGPACCQLSALLFKWELSEHSSGPLSGTRFQPLASPSSNGFMMPESACCLLLQSRLVVHMKSVYTERSVRLQRARRARIHRDSLAIDENQSLTMRDVWLLPVGGERARQVPRQLVQSSAMLMQFAETGFRDVPVQQHGIVIDALLTHTPFTLSDADLVELLRVRLVPDPLCRLPAATLQSSHVHITNVCALVIACADAGRLLHFHNILTSQLSVTSS